jgi:hypothetical protein
MIQTDMYITGIVNLELRDDVYYLLRMPQPLQITPEWCTSARTWRPEAVRCQ